MHKLNAFPRGLVDVVWPPLDPSSLVELLLESRTIESDSLVDELYTDLRRAKSSMGWKSCVNMGGTYPFLT